MTYLNDLNTYLHQSSLLIQAYPTTRITTKYSLPRKSSKSNTKPSHSPADNTTTPSTQQKEKREPSATLTLKTFHDESGICLKYRTDKAQEVSRLIGGLGRLAKGEIIEEPATSASGVAVTAGDKMDVDEPVPVEKIEAAAPQPQPQQQSQGSNKKKKKGKK